MTYNTAKMPITYDQTYDTVWDDETIVTSIGPRPVPPPYSKPNELGYLMWFNVSENATYILHKKSNYIERLNSDGSTTFWFSKPTMQEAVNLKSDTPCYFRFYPDGSVILREMVAGNMYTAYYGEDREVDLNHSNK